MDANNQQPAKPKVLEVIETLDARLARVAFLKAMHTKPKTTIEIIKGTGAPIYRVTIIESSWNDFG